MTNLEWLKTRDLITTNDVYRETLDNTGKIGVNVFIKLRDSDYYDYIEKGIEWLLEEHKEPIKLTKFEYDLLMSYINKGYFFKNYSELKEMRYKGYFKGITDTSMKIQDILKNCEVIE